MGDCSSNNCNPCGPDLYAINQIAAKAAAYARTSERYSVDSANSATNSESSANLSEQFFIEFNALYLGAFSVAPTVDNEGNPLQAGALYWNTVTNNLWVWSGTAWVDTVDFNQLTLFQTNGTTANRNLYNRLTDGVTPKDFGADPSLPNNTTAIQAWLNYGGNLQGTKGTYVVTSTLTIPNDNTVINGNGMEITYNTSSLTSVIQAINKSHITVRNLKVNGRKDLKTPTGNHPAYGFYFQNCSNVIVDGCYVQNTIEHGIRVGIAESLPAAISRNIKIVNNAVLNCGNTITQRGSGIWLYGLVNDFVIANNTIMECPTHGIFVDDSHSLPNLDVLRGNVTSNVVSITTPTGYRNTGIGFSGNRDICITGNISLGYEVGLRLSSVQARTQTGFGEISGNYIEALKEGLSLRNIQYVDVSNNTVITTNSTTNDEMCINLYSDDSFDANSYVKSVKISNNLCYAYRKGIGINDYSTGSRWADDVVVFGNRVEYTGPTPISGVGASEVKGISVNETTGNSRPGKVFVSNNIVSKFRDGIYFVAATPTYCIGNIVEECENWGIRTANDTFAIVARNTCRSNANADFVVSGGGDAPTTILKDNEAFSTTELSGGASTTKQNNLNF